MPHRIGKLKELFHPRENNDDASSNMTPSPNPRADRTSSRFNEPVVHVLPAFAQPYETIEAQRAPYMGDVPLTSDGQRSTTRAQAQARSMSPQNANDDAAIPYQHQSALLEDLQNLQHLDINKKDGTPTRTSAEIDSHNRRVTKAYRDRNIRHSAHFPIDEAQDVHHQRSPEHKASRSEDVTAIRNDSLQQASPTRNRQSQDFPSPDLGRRFSISRKPVGEAPTSPRNVRFEDIDSGTDSSVTTPTDSNFSHDDRKMAVSDAPQAPSLRGVVDLTNTEDTTVHETMAPAVTHETVDQHVHHIREEQIYRDIHTHDVFHRILPITDIQVLPARHFVPTSDGGLVEIAQDEVPGRTGDNMDWLVAETVSKPSDKSAHLRGPRRFTARRFRGKEGDHREQVGKDGVPRKETTWVHPPELEQGGRLTGQTEEFRF